MWNSNQLVLEHVYIASRNHHLYLSDCDMDSSHVHLKEREYTFIGIYGSITASLNVF